ncbi:MAG: hypothetical protein WBX38_17045 [Candidatus Sulfotelmatobacter sp.]
MSACAVAWFKRLRFDQPDFFEAMTGAAKLVLRSLCERQSDFGEGICRASHNEIAIELGYSDDHVARMVKWLIQNRAITLFEQERDERGKVRKRSWVWASRYEFGLGFVFKPAQNHPLRSPTIDRLIPDISSLDPRHSVDSAQPHPYKDQKQVNQPLPPLATVLEEFEIKDSHRALARGLGLDAGVVFAKLKDYCLATGKRYENLDSALNLWLRNERAPRASTSLKQSHAQRAEQVQAEAERILDEIAEGRKKLPRASGE